MEYNFGTETQSGSKYETNLSVSNSCETMCAALSFRVGIPLSPLTFPRKTTKTLYEFYVLTCRLNIFPTSKAK